MFLNGVNDASGLVLQEEHSGASLKYGLGGGGMDGRAFYEKL